MDNLTCCRPEITGRRVLVHVVCATRLRAARAKGLLLGSELIGQDEVDERRRRDSSSSDTRDLISNASITTTSCSFSLAGHRRRSTTDGFPGSRDSLAARLPTLSSCPARSPSPFREVLRLFDVGLSLTTRQSRYLALTRRARSN